MNKSTVKTLESLVTYAKSVRNTDWYIEFKRIYDSSHYCVASKYLKTIPESYLLRLKDSTPSWYEGKKYYICDREELAILRYQTKDIYNKCVVCKSPTRNTHFCKEGCRSLHKRGQLSFYDTLADNPKINTELIIWAKRLTNDPEYIKFCTLYDKDVLEAKKFLVGTDIAKGFVKRTLSPYALLTDYNSWYLGDLKLLRSPYKPNTCAVCGKPTTFNRKEANFNATCSKKCAWEISHSARKATNRERYGFDYCQQNEDIKDKVTETTMKNYGVKRPAQNKKINDKIKATRKQRKENGDYDLLPYKQQVTVQANRVIRNKYNPERCIYTDARGRTHKSLQGYEPLALKTLESKFGKSIKRIYTKVQNIIPGGLTYYDRHSKSYRRYFPDFKIVGKNKTRIVEVKSLGTLDLVLTTNISKFRKATRYCQEHGMEFLVLIHRYPEDMNPIMVLNPTKLSDLCVKGLSIKRSVSNKKYGRVSYTYERKCLTLNS